MLFNLSHVSNLKKVNASFLDSISIGGLPKNYGTFPRYAPDIDYLHYFDLSDNNYLDITGQDILNVYTAKDGKLSPNYRFGEIAGTSLLNTGLINGLQAAQTPGSLRWIIDPLIIPAGEFMYPNMTFFAVLKTGTNIARTNFIWSDYGDVKNKVIYLKIGNGTNLEVVAVMRDSALNNVVAKSGVVFLSQSTDYLIVCRYDGTNKTITLWIDGGVPYSDTNALYDPTTTWEGEATPTSVPTIAELSDVFTTGDSFQGDLGALFITRTALSNNDINLYASYLAHKWGTIWIDV